MFMCMGFGFFELLVFLVGVKLIGMWLMLYECGCGVVLVDGGVLFGSVFGVILIFGLIVWFGLWCIVFVIVGVGMMLVGVFVWCYICNYLFEYLGVNVVEFEYIMCVNVLM